MALLELEEFREFVNSDIDDTALQVYLDDAEEEIIRRFGEHSATDSQVDWLDGGDEYLFPTRIISAVGEVIETVGDDDTTLAVDDYELQDNGRTLRRLDDGTNVRSTWGERVKLTYTPDDDTASRKRVQKDLVALALQFDGLTDVRDGDWHATMPDYEDTRESILRRLAPRHRVII